MQQRYLPPRLEISRQPLYTAFSLLAGTCTIYYYEKDGGGIDGSALMSDVMRTTQTPTEPTHELQLRYDNGATTHEVKFKCLLNQVAIAATAGDIVTAQITFSVTGPLQTATIA